MTSMFVSGQEIELWDPPKDWQDDTPFGLGMWRRAPMRCVSAIMAAEWRIRDESRLLSHYHDHHEYVEVLSGYLILDVYGTIHRLMPGESIHILAGVRHQARYPVGGHVYAEWYKNENYVVIRSAEQYLHDTKNTTKK